MLPIMLRNSSDQHCPYPVKLNDFTCYSFEQEPFKSLPLIWTIHERSLATRSRQYISSGQIDLLNDWKRVFNRSTVVVFPNYVLPVIFNGLYFSFTLINILCNDLSHLVHMERVLHCIQLKKSPVCNIRTFFIFKFPIYYILYQLGKSISDSGNISNVQIGNHNLIK